MAVCRAAALLGLALALVQPNRAWTPPACTKNADCEGDIGPADGEVIEDVGVATLMWAAADTRNATYCAQLNGTKGCMPCAFYSLDSTADGSPGAGATVDDLAEFAGMVESSCYTSNGWLSPTDKVWFDLESTVENPTDAKDIRDAGCGQCDARLPASAQGGVAGTVCKLHTDCQENHYCDRIEYQLADGSPAAGTCDEGRLTHFTDEDLECNEPFDCAPGTDTKGQCLGNMLVCQECGSEVDITLIHCHELVPVDFKNMWSGTSKPMRVIYGGLIACTLVYPLWCSVVFFLKNFTRCCGGAKYSWGM
eukprot:COSAG02_NODE_2572_length_8501_cov_8.319448_2_plen_308_part_00